MKTQIDQSISIETGLPSPNKLVVLHTLASGSSTLLLPMLLAAAVLLMWELGVRLANVPEVILPSPSAILEVLISKH